MQNTQVKSTTRYKQHRASRGQGAIAVRKDAHAGRAAGRGAWWWVWRWRGTPGCSAHDRLERGSTGESEREHRDGDAARRRRLLHPGPPTGASLLQVAWAAARQAEQSPGLLWLQVPTVLSVVAGARLGRSTRSGARGHRSAPIVAGGRLRFLWFLCRPSHARFSR